VRYMVRGAEHFWHREVVGVGRSELMDGVDDKDLKNKKKKKKKKKKKATNALSRG